MRTSITFTSTFLKTPLLDESQPGPSQPTPSPPEPLSYSRAKHGSIGAFIASPDFAGFKQEYTKLIDSIADFVDEHADQMNVSQQRRDKVKKDLDELKQHLFEGNFFNPPNGVDHRPEMYGAAKGMLHTFTELLQDDRIPLQQRMKAAETVAERAPLCSGGILSDLQEATALMQASRAGMKGIAHQWKKNMLEAVILNYVKARHVYGRSEEIHYVNAYYNALAEELGVRKRSDPYADNLWRKRVISDATVGKCREEVDKKLKFKPTLLATAMADQYRAEIEGSLAQGDSAADHISMDDFRKLESTVKALQPEYGNVPLASILETTDEGELAYTGAKRPTALARHFLKELKHQEIVDYEKKNRIVLGGDGEGGRLKKLGDLFWVKDADKMVQELTAHALFKLSPKELLANIEKAEPDHAQERVELLGVVLQRGAELLEAKWPAEENLLGTWLQDCAAEMKEHRSSVQGMSKPVVLLATHFNQATALDALLEAGGDKDAKAEDGATALMLAARSGHIEAMEALVRHKANLDATDAYGNTALMFAVSNGHVKVLDALCEAGADIKAKNKEGHTGLYLALEKGNADVVRAFGELLQQIPKEECAELLAAKDAFRVPGLYWFLKNGNAKAVKAFCELLRHVPEAQHAELLAAKDAVRVPGLYWFLKNGNAEAVRAFGELLKQVPDAQRVPEAQRVRLLAAKTADGVPGLYMALQNGHAEAVRAFGELLQQEQVPKAQCAELLAAENGNGVSGLHLALENGHAEAVKAFGEQLEHISAETRVELLSPLVLGIFVSRGLASAIENEHIAALDEYIDIVKKTAPGLSPQDRATLLAYIEKSQSMNILGFVWGNSWAYSKLKERNPDFCSRFEKMKEDLQR